MISSRLNSEEASHIEPLNLMIEDLVAGPLLCYEAYETHSWHGEPATPLHMLSLDASKCFDRITFESASREGRRCGLPSRLLGTLLGFWSVMIRSFSVGGYLDEVALLPQNGVPQGCPLSALLCNTIVQDWHGAIEHTPCHTGAFLDDRVLWAHNHPDLLSGWEKSLEWERLQGWVLNTSKSCHIQVPASPVPASPETLSGPTRASSPNGPMSGGKCCAYSICSPPPNEAHSEASDCSAP